MRAALALALVASLVVLAPAQDVVKKAVVKKAAKAAVAADPASVVPAGPPCENLDMVEKLLPQCDVSKPETRESIECRNLLKGAGSKELGTAIKVGGVRGATYILPASAGNAGKHVKLGGSGHGSLFTGSVTPADISKPVAFTLRTFHGAAPIGEKIADLNIKDFSFLGTPENLAGGAVGVITEQCDEAKLQPGTRALCGVCLVKADNLKELAISPDTANDELVTMKLKDGDTELAMMVDSAPAPARAAGALVAGLAAAAAAAVLL